MLGGSGECGEVWSSEAWAMGESTQAGSFEDAQGLESDLCGSVKDTPLTTA